MLKINSNLKIGNLSKNFNLVKLVMKGGHMVNQVVLVGRLTENPVVEEASNGKKHTAINIAVQRNFKNSEGIYETDFIRCVLWNGMASNTKEYCHTGDIVGIKGRLQNRSYENEQKEKKYITEVIVERITFLASSSKNTKDKKDNIQFVDCY